MSSAICAEEATRSENLKSSPHDAEQPDSSAPRPFAYLLPPTCQAAAQQLAQRGITVRILREDVELDVEVYTVRKLDRAESPGEAPSRWNIDTERRTMVQRCTAGSYLVRTDQSSGTLAGALLEPQSPDGLATQGVFADCLQAGHDFPVVRVPRGTPLLTADPVSPEDAAGARKPITFETLYGSKPVDFQGNPMSIVRWLDDGEHFLQSKEGQLCRVHAVSGRCTPLYEATALANNLKGVAALDDSAARRLAERAGSHLNPQVTAALLDHNHDLYYVTLDGKTANRLTDSPAPEELATFSPDGQRVAFVRNDDLYVVDVGGTKERRLTETGSTTVHNGKADWVYYEEVFNRSWRAYSWSPDSQGIAFLQFDDGPVSSFTLTNPLEVHQPTEFQRFPLAGTPNPRVRLGVVRAHGGDVQWVNTDTYLPDNMLITHVGWMPDSKSLYYYVQDRTQRWLDVVRFELGTQISTRLFREQTQAWVDNPGALTFLPDASFLWLSERDGWRHVYHYRADGTLVQRVTEGEWEVREILVADAPGERICFSATRDSHLAENLYQVCRNGTDLKRLTSAPGSHHITANSRGTLLIDSHSDVTRPARVQLCDSQGQTLRVLDANPVASISRYELSPVELVRIPLKDGFVVEGSLIKPPGFDVRKKYPVWLLTYGGPHAPTLSDSWQGGRTFEQLLAHMGIIAFRCDPRSASGKGAVSTWTAYRQLGVQELRDIEEVLDWLAAQPFVDSARIGMSGHSYGGFLTAFALTHSKRFAAGIAGAPVTDWRNYDSIYTERYMLTPQENPDGYRQTSVVTAAKDLHGRLLLIHGARDDNVHLTNTLQLVNALQKANQTFELMIYPPDRHGISGEHYRRLMVDFIRRTMLDCR